MHSRGTKAKPAAKVEQWQQRPTCQSFKAKHSGLNLNTPCSLSEKQWRQLISMQHFHNHEIASKNYFPMSCEKI